MAAMSVIAGRATMSDSSSPSPAPNGSDALQVVCAWPVSGQYGPGSRFLYYVLIAACVFGRKAELIRNACLAVALVFPAVAAIHGLVLASVHVNGAVDMDVFGAFQLCSIGILAAPLTVRLSRTYFYDPGRNTIFLWTALVLAGLLSLTVEFYRVTTSPCTHDDSGNPISRSVSDFPYTDAQCGLVCSEGDGPYSPMRGGAASNIYVIPAPDVFTFNTAFLVAAACCIPAILSLAFTWFQILEMNWKTRFGGGDEDEPISGTNGATNQQMKGINKMIRLFLSVIEVPLFGAAVLAILIGGEVNLFSSQMRFETEPIASIGQWAPIAGTVLAALGSLYVVLSGKMYGPEETDQDGDDKSFVHHCNCSQHHHEVVGLEQVERIPTLRVQHSASHSPSHREARSLDDDGTEFRRIPSRRATDSGSRRKVATALTTMANKLGTAAHDKFDTSEFKRGKARDFPMIPAEMQRNPNLPQIRELYNPPRDSDGNVTPDLRPRHSRAGSFTSISVSSGLGIEGLALEGSSSPRRTESPRSMSPGPSSPALPPPRLVSPGEGHRRRNTLEVPSPTRYRTT